jgi:hypothetical protein
MSLFDVVMFGGMSSGSPDGASANRQNLPRKPLPKGPSRSANASRRLGYERLREMPLRLWRWSGPERIGVSWAAAKSGLPSA